MASDDARKRRQDELARMVDLTGRLREAERLRKQRRAEGQAQGQARLSEAVQGEAAAEQKRGKEQTAWRVGKHRKRTEEEAARQRNVVQAEREAASRHEHEAADRKRQEYMDDLHRTSVQKRKRARQQQAVREEELTVEKTEKREEITVRDADAKERSTVNHLEAERKKRKAQAGARRETMLKRAEQEALLARRRAAKEEKEVDLEQASTTIERERRRAVDAVEQAWNDACATIDAEMNRLVQQAKTEARQRRGIAEKRAVDNRARAARRRQETEKWLGIPPVEE